ncbi:HPr family phosphocarrier protein [Citrobacter koseri]|uniref:HPr family phosphocarrier protein n=1 Tax=Citrobacter koseri TaxID=545 RepID=UPI001C62F725|nr:HPr family phosphocarrier protein [Citrobacter koseri]QYG86338.1 HPr family phosphocarrier protein [Citrobacter koseri]
MKQFQYTIKDDLGIHARPAGLLVRLAIGFNSTINISKHDRLVNLKKIFSLMSLNVKCGDTVTITADGNDEQSAINTLQKFFQQNL